MTSGLTREGTARYLRDVGHALAAIAVLVLVAGTVVGVVVVVAALV
jgi:hypothetical protein